MIQNNNSVEISGEVVSGPVFDHETFGERFYKFFISAERLSGCKDIIPVIVSERLFNIDNITIGKKFRVFGQFRSFNDHSDGGNHMILFVFAQEINEAEDDDKEHGDIRFVFACYNAGIGDVNDPFLHEKSSVTKLEHPENILLICFTFEVLNELIFKLTSELQFLNIPP